MLSSNFFFSYKKKISTSFTSTHDVTLYILVVVISLFEERALTVTRGLYHVSLTFPLLQKPRAKPVKKSTKDREPKDKKKKGNLPKRPLSAYMFFSQDWRERIKTENPEASFGEIGKLLGAKWKEMDAEEKKVPSSFLCPTLSILFNLHSH
jgi:hypothetical protein